MSGAIGPGDWVETTRDTETQFFSWRARSVTRVRRFLNRSGTCGLCGTRVERAIVTDLHPDKPEFGSCPCHFRPISGGERGMFDHMLKLDAPTKEPVAA